MPLNTQIPLMLGGSSAPQQSQSPFSFLGEMMELRRMREYMDAQQELTRERKMQGDIRERAFNDETFLRGVFQRHTAPGKGEPDYDQVFNELYVSGRGTIAQALRDKLFEVRKQEAETLSKTAETQWAKVNTASKIAQGIHDDDDLQRALPQIRTLMGEQVAAMFPVKYDADVINQLVEQGMSNADHLRKQMDVFQRSMETLDKTQTWMNNEVTRAKGATEIYNDWIKRGSEIMSLSRNAEDWDANRTLLQRGMDALPVGVRQTVLNAFADKYSKTAVEEARLLGMTQAERVNEKLQREGLAIQWKRLANEDATAPMTPEAKDIVAHQFAMGVPLPALGLGPKSTQLRVDIINRAAELYKGLNIPLQIAAFAASKQSLVQLQGQLDAVTAFENTALKNAEIFLQQAGKIIDTGSPLVNRPLRMFSEQVLGSPNMAAFQAARRTVIPEFARILQNPRLTGILSDQGRQEIEALIPETATLKQVTEIMRILKRDAENRRTEYQDQVNAIEKRLASPPRGTVHESQFPPNSTLTIEQDGKKYEIQTDHLGKVISQREIR